MRGRLAARPDPMPHLITVARAVAQTGQPETALMALDRALDGAFGHRLFTVLVVNLEKNENQRYYSNRPEEYPVGGTKPIVHEGLVAQRVIAAGECHINRNYEDVRNVFSDHELIRSLGCESSINVPVRWNGRTFGMLNLLHETGWYSEQDIPILSVFAAMAVPVLQHLVRS